MQKKSGIYNGECLQNKKLSTVKIDGCFLAKKSGIYSVRTIKNITAWCGAEIKKL